MACLIGQTDACKINRRQRERERERESMQRKAGPRERESKEKEQTTGVMLRGAEAAEVKSMSTLQEHK